VRDPQNGVADANGVDFEGFTAPGHADGGGVVILQKNRSFPDVCLKSAAVEARGLCPVSTSDVTAILD